METKQLMEATCPECRGPLSEVRQGNGLREYRCLVGHTYSARSLLQAHSEAQEKSMWASVVALREAANLVHAVGPQFAPPVQERLERQAEQKLRQAVEIEKLLEQLEPFHTD